MLDDILLWLFVIVSGIAVGAGLYEMRVAVPQWFRRAPGPGLRVDSEAMRRADSGRRFWAYVTTGPLTLLTLASLPVAWGAGGPRSGWWLAAALVSVVERAGTLGYFIPRALRLMRAEALPPAKAGAMASQWVALNRIRAAIALAAWLAALRALSLPG